MKKGKTRNDHHEMKNFTNKGKHKVHIVNHLCKKLVGGIKNKSSKIIDIHNNRVRDTQDN